MKRSLEQAEFVNKGYIGNAEVEDGYHDIEVHGMGLSGKDKVDFKQIPVPCWMMCRQCDAMTQYEFVDKESYETAAHALRTHIKAAHADVVRDPQKYATLQFMRLWKSNVRMKRIKADVEDVAPVLPLMTSHCSSSSSSSSTSSEASLSELMAKTSWTAYGPQPEVKTNATEPLTPDMAIKLVMATINGMQNLIRDAQQRPPAWAESLLRQAPAVMALTQFASQCSSSP
jgi:hypothetical protein